MTCFPRRRFLRTFFGGGTALLGGCSPLSLVNAFAPSATYRASTGIAYGTHVRNRLDVYRPAEQPGPAPVVVFFYGGNWNTGDRDDYLFVGEALASKGFVAVLPDYRLYPEVRFPGFLEDCAQAVRWTFEHIAEFGGDPQRVFLMGHSAGAYNAAMLALNREYLRSAGVDPRHVRGLIGLAGPYDFLPIREPVSRLVFGYPDTPIATQPIHFAGTESPPALLATGKDDDVVNPGNSARLVARLRDSGVQASLIVYPNLGHRSIAGALASPLRGLAPVLEDVAGFVKEISAK